MVEAPAVEFSGVTFAYESTPVLVDVNLSIQRDECVSIVGPNGGGKTTLLLLMLGLLRPDTGTVRIFGKPPHQARRRIGYTPQHARFDPQFPVSVLDVVLMGRVERRRWGCYRREDRLAAQAALDEVDMADQRETLFNALSGGQRQRVLIARALACEPDLLLLDEPTAHVDAVIGDRLVGLLQDLSKQMTILLVSHDFGFVSSVVHSVICVNRKVVVHPTSGITGAVIRDMYGEEVRIVDHETHLHGHGGSGG